MVEALLGAGAGLDVPTWEGVTPLQLASRRGDLALARLLLHWGASTGTSSLPTIGTSYPALDLAPTRPLPELEEEEVEEVEEQEEELVVKKKEDKMKKQKDKKVTDKKEYEGVKEKESTKKEGKMITVKVVSKNKEKKTSNEEGNMSKPEDDNMSKPEDDQSLWERASVGRMVRRACCSVCGEREAALGEVEGLFVCLPCTNQQQASYSTASSTLSSSASSTLAPGSDSATSGATRRTRKAAQN